MKQAPLEKLYAVGESSISYSVTTKSFNMSTFQMEDVEQKVSKEIYYFMNMADKAKDFYQYVFDNRNN